MTILKVGGFEGEIPRIVPRLLPENAATKSTNARLESGGLTPYRKPKFTARLPGVITNGAVRTIYRDDGVVPSQWLSWDKQVYIAPGPVAADRLYVMGDGAPKIRAGGAWYPLALPFPTAAPVATPSGTGTGDVFTRVYAYTWVSQFDEETEPCPLYSGTTGHVPSLQHDGSRSGWTKSGDAIEKGRLSCSIWSDNSMYLAPRHAQTHVGNGNDASETLLEALDIEERNGLSTVQGFARFAHAHALSSGSKMLASQHMLSKLDQS